MRLWDSIADTFNAEFEGKCIPGSAERQTKQTVGMLYCALLHNEGEYKRLLSEAEEEFWAAKGLVEGREERWRLWGLALLLWEVVGAGLRWMSHYVCMCI